MLDVLGALFLSIFAVALAVLGIGAVSETRKKAAEEKNDGGFASELKAYGISSRASNQNIPEIKDSEKRRMLYQNYEGIFNPSTGDIEQYGNEDSILQHEGFHRGHLIETIAPTKKLRKELNSQWSTNKKNLSYVKEQVSQLPRNPVVWKIESRIEDKSKNGNYATIIMDAAKNKKEPLEELKTLSSEYEQERDSIVAYASYKYAERKFEKVNSGYKKLINGVIESFLNSKLGDDEIKIECYRHLKDSEAHRNMITPEMRESARKELSTELYKGFRFNQILDIELFNNFEKFAIEHHSEDIGKLKKLRKSQQEYRNKLDSKSDYVDNYYEAKSDTYFVEAIKKYIEHHKTDKSFDVDPSVQKNFSPLTESFAYYMNVQRGDRLEEEAKETLLESGKYAKDNRERLNYEIALRSVFKIHEGVKKYGNLSDDDALKIILPMSKYVRSVNELELFAGDERNIKELAQYSKIALNVGEDSTNSFGEYRGLQALRHYKNTGKIH